MTSTNSNDESVPDVPLAFVSNTYLNELTKDIRTRPIPWEGYQKAELITPEELDLLKRIDKQSREQLRSVMQKDAEKYAELYTSLLEKLKRFDTIQYILVMTNDMLSDDEKRASYFHKLSSKSSDLPYRPFLKQPLSFDTTDFLRWISTKLKSNNNNICDLAVQILESILKIPSCRLQFWEMPHAPEANLPAMLVAKLLNFCENLSVRKWSDSEIVEDIEFLKAQLQENFHSLTTFDEYASEIRSGMLQWSPPHESEQFWKQNVTKLNDKNHELLKILSRLLSTSTDNVVLAVAAHDLGQYVKYYPDGKKCEIGAKQRVMELMTHEDPEVRYNALIAVQKYMSHAW
ncbi:11058_t:CDS:2 [Gigaspora margarita]|uniref:11058_t:CDS:1 n=1 Tax=Gigaspora margarita TaxID=4874 RepID=A0ABN7UYS6_GIGMA|nr:11058_t:CDS:2 [Gigaspora margarita]